MISHPGYANSLPERAVINPPKEGMASGLHSLCADEIGLRDQDRLNAARIHGLRASSVTCTSLHSRFGMKDDL